MHEKNNLCCSKILIFPQYLILRNREQNLHYIPCMKPECTHLWLIVAENAAKRRREKIMQENI